MHLVLIYSKKMDLTFKLTENLEETNKSKTQNALTFDLNQESGLNF